MTAENEILAKLISSTLLPPQVSTRMESINRPGFIFGDHTYPDEVEIVYVLHGASYVGINNQFIRIKKNDCLIIFPQITHNYFLKENESCKILLILSSNLEICSALVDSAYAAKAIAEYGAVEALRKIDGAFVFVWHNLEDNTLNIARNGMREIWFIADKEGENLFFASEYLMMDSVRARNGFDVHGQYRSPTEFTMISWNLDKPFLKPKATKFEEYKPPKYEPPYKGSFN